jgi:hypothetical protein
VSLSSTTWCLLFVSGDNFTGLPQLGHVAAFLLTGSSQALHFVSSDMLSSGMRLQAKKMQV